MVTTLLFLEYLGLLWYSSNLRRSVEKPFFKLYWSLSFNWIPHIYPHTCTHTLNLFHYAPKGFGGAPSHSTSELSHAGVLWKLSCEFLQNRCAIPVQGKLHAHKLRVQIGYNPLPLLCPGLKNLSEINLIHANVPKRNARFSWQMHKISCCHRIP